MLGTQQGCCSMWSVQLSDALSSQAWSSAGVLGLLAGWHVPSLVDLPSLDFLAAFSRLVLARDVCCTEVVPSVGPRELVCVGVC